jgi:hypothetical protein
MTACTVDVDRLARERENIRTLCERPVLTATRLFCERYVTPAPSPSAPAA